MAASASASRSILQPGKAAGSILAAIGHNLGQAIDAGLSTTLSITDIAEQALAGSIGAANDNTAWSQMRAVA